MISQYDDIRNFVLLPDKIIYGTDQTTICNYKGETLFRTDYAALWIRNVGGNYLHLSLLIISIDSPCIIYYNEILNEGFVCNYESGEKFLLEDARQSFFVGDHLAVVILHGSNLLEIINLKNGIRKSRVIPHQLRTTISFAYQSIALNYIYHSGRIFLNTENGVVIYNWEDDSFQESPIKEDFYSFEVNCEK